MSKISKEQRTILRLAREYREAELDRAVHDRYARGLAAANSKADRARRALLDAVDELPLEVEVEVPVTQRETAAAMETVLAGLASAVGGVR